MTDCNLLTLGIGHLETRSYWPRPLRLKRLSLASRIATTTPKFLALDLYPAARTRVMASAGETTVAGLIAAARASPRLCAFLERRAVGRGLFVRGPRRFVR